MVVVTGGSSRPEPMISIRSGADFFWETGAVDRTVIPSMSMSASARRTSPTLAPPGSTAASSVPLGWRAPAARQVHVPSGRALVSSISMRGIAGLNLAEHVPRQVDEVLPLRAERHSGAAENTVEKACVRPCGPG